MDGPASAACRMAFAASARRGCCRQPLGVVGIIVPWNYPVFSFDGAAGRRTGGGESRAAETSEFYAGNVRGFEPDDCKFIPAGCGSGGLR